MGVDEEELAAKREHVSNVKYSPYSCMYRSREEGERGPTRFQGRLELLQWTSNSRSAKVKAVPFSFKKVRKRESLFRLLVHAWSGG